MSAKSSSKASQHQARSANNKQNRPVSKSASSKKRTNKSAKISSKSSQKAAVGKRNISKSLHPRNKHNHGYDFERLIKAVPSLRKHVKTNDFGHLSIDFADPLAVKALNGAILYSDYDIREWDIPQGFLCPPIPGRVDYLHYIADLIGARAGSKRKVKALDIGTGANGVYPLLGIREYQWQFVASDIDPISLDNVGQIATANSLTATQLQLRQQANADNVFVGVIHADDRFDVTLCNPPFHKSLADAMAGTKRKLANLDANRKAKFGDKAAGQSKAIGNKAAAQTNTKGELNFGGQKAELWCDGGEIQFLSNMINESKQFAFQVRWFTTLVSKSENLKPCKALLAKHKAAQVKQIDMHQGNKITRILAWSFMDAATQKQWLQLS
ncbi:23S rRNA (adenine(1618)-N(6))-methyltransferase RlmF [Shewanella maritima]|uniref:Ribosomal RNA large subunit methyltransferase F n=1 Tax=Shewanella maritima TaxID=2520507 RepID=A0A411PHU7_9GAMM|nr:23S rRNA (adenine(1618)-N(6))-methyltransferase RlmF [Shewanella maritima]QBF82952.1 23S rRNA (adenine(1618)-N(6))-methyltransferase RlmF [Shewanella maritima]